MGQFLGFVGLGSQLKGAQLVKNTSNSPVNADSLPTYRIYGPSGLMNAATGSLSLKETGAITGATNASPIVVTSAGHGLTVGMKVTITGVLGNTAANGTFTVSAADSNTFTLSGSTGNGAYTSGGTWNTSGLYDIAFTPTGGNGFAAGTSYTLVVYAMVSATITGDVHTFVVV